MHKTSRRPISILAAFLMVVALLGAAPDVALAQDNSAVAINTKDGSSLFKFAFDVKRVMGDVVDQTNAAVAYSSCEQCTTVAVAIQLVLVMGDPEVVAPENYAIAVNYECVTCTTMALAYQIVLSVDGPVHFTAEGNKRLAEIRKAAHDLLKSDATPEELAAGIDSLVDQFKEVLATELVEKRSDDDEDDEESEEEESEEADDDEDDSDTEQEATPTPTPTPEATTEPTESPSPEPTEEATP